jgi:hypothetical protein
MNRKDDFDQTLAAWLRREAPPQAPDRVLDAALERVAAQSQQRGWLQRLIGGTPVTTLTRVMAVAAVIAFAAFIGYQFSSLPPDVGASPSPSGEATQTGAPSTSSSPAPSADPAVAALVLRLERGAEAGPRTHLLTVLEDGRIITTSYDQFGGNPSVERRLTAAGVQLLRDELDATGLSFLASADYSPVSNPGVEPPGYGGSGPALEVGLSGGGTAVISWYFLNDDGLYFEPQPEAEALEALYARLSTLDEWLPANAWADANARPYAPARYRIFIYSQTWGGSLDDLPVESATVSWPLIEGIDVYGDVVKIVTQETGDIGPYPRCRPVSAEEATPVIEALGAAGATPGVYSMIPGTSFALGYRATSRVVTITLEPILPHADVSCGLEIPF